jgi:putative membrane protein
MGVGMLVFWSFVAFVVLTVVPQSRTQSEPEQGAREILDERYARGEIQEDEYRHRSELIRS